MTASPEPAAPAPSSQGAGDGGLLRVRLDLAYEGTAFSGWAAQPGLRTVQGTLAEGLAQVLRLPVEDVVLVVAGRTDAGVHARGQVAHVDVPVAAWEAAPGRSTAEPGTALRRRLAGVLPDDVVVHRVAVAPEGFDARFSALRRRYAYRLCDDPAALDPLRRHEVLAVRGDGAGGGALDVPAMDAAARSLVGLNDFAAFCRRREGATTVRTLLEYSWRREPAQDASGGLVVACVVADAFCHSMVRALVGGALAVGQGRRPPQWLAEVLAAGKRDPGVVVVPPHGLVLEEVTYPPDDELAARAATSRAVRTLQ